MAKLIHPLFEDNDWEWSGYGVPEEKDIVVTLRQLERHAEDMPDGTTLEIGRLMLKKDEGLHVYVKVGTVEETT